MQTLKILSNVPIEKKNVKKIKSKKSFKCALKIVSKKSLMGALRKCRIQASKKSLKFVLQKSVVQNFRRSPSRVPKQIKKCQTKGFKSYFIPYFASLVPSFGISPPVMGSLQRSGNTGDEAKGGDGRGNSEPAPTSTPRRMDGKWSGNCFSVGSVAFVLLPTY